MKFPLSMLLLPFLALLGCDNAVQETSSSTSPRTGAATFRITSPTQDSSTQGDSVVIVLRNGDQSKEVRAGAASFQWLEELQAGTWQVEVVLRHRGAETSRTVATLEVRPGALSTVRFLRELVDGNWRLTVQVDGDAGALGADTAAFRKAIQGTWHLESLPVEGLASIPKDVILSLDSTGRLIGSDGCNALIGSWSVLSDSLLRINSGIEGSKACGDLPSEVLLERGMHLVSEEMHWQIQGRNGSKRLTLRSSYTGSILATFVDSLASAAPVDLQPIPKGHEASDAKELIGNWYLSSFPLEGIDSVKIEVPLVLDSTGWLKGTDGCHPFQGTWSVQSDTILRLNMIQDSLACADTGSTLKITWGMHLLGYVDLRWTILSVDSLGVKTLLLRSDLTGKELALFKSQPVVP